MILVWLFKIFLQWQLNANNCHWRNVWFVEDEEYFVNQPFWLKTKNVNFSSSSTNQQFWLEKQKNLRMNFIYLYDNFKLEKKKRRHDGLRQDADLYYILL